MNKKHALHGEFGRSRDVRTGFIKLATVRGWRAVQYANIDGMAVFEGDIVLGRVSDMEAVAEAILGDPSLQETGEIPIRGVGITGAGRRWPRGIVPYTIAPSLPNQQRVHDAIAHWESETTMRFVLRTPANAAQYPNFITFTPGNGCSSNVGMVGGEQRITLAAGCDKGNTIHEIGHAVSLWHEQSREDRDTFVRINRQNIIAGTEHNFDQHITDGDDLGTYDFGSIMHYPATAFSSNGQPTIVTLGGQPIGQRVRLSDGDLAAVRALYPTRRPLGYTWDVDRTQHVVYDAASRIHELWFDGQWHYNDLTAAAAGAPQSNGDPAAYTWSVDKTQHVVYLGFDDHIHELWFNGQWHHNDLTTAANAPLSAGNPAGYTWDVDHTQHVVYRGGGHIHELWFDGQWHHNDLTVAAGAPPAVSEPSGYTWDVDRTQHVVHLSGDGHIHELWFDGQWHHNDLTVAAGAPLSVGRPAGYTWSVDSTQHVVYRGADNHVHELWFDGQWHHNDLNVAADAPIASLDPTGYTWDVDHTQHVVYRGADNHVHELWFDGRWHHNDLTIAAEGAPLSASAPAGYTWDVDRTQHVVYRGVDDHVHELWFDGRWHHNDLTVASGAPPASSDVEAAQSEVATAEESPRDASPIVKP